MSVGTTMAKKKAKRVVNREGWNEKPIVAQLRGSEEFGEWLVRASKACRLSVSKFLEIAAVEKAKAAGFEEEAPDR